MFDAIKIRITPEGKIVTETGDVSGINHSNAEEFLGFLAALSGGQVEIIKGGADHEHSHVHHDGTVHHDHSH